MWDAQLGELGSGGGAIATDDIAEENERLAAEIAAMQSQLSPGASSPTTLVHKLPPPKVGFPVYIDCPREAAFNALVLRA